MEKGHQVFQIQSKCFSNNTQNSLVSSELHGNTTLSWDIFATLGKWRLQEEYMQKYRDVSDERAMGCH